MPRLGLALSGGGFRATLYHLGVVRFLRDAGELQKLKALADGSEMRCPDNALDAEMRTAIDSARKAGDTLGGSFVVFALGLPPGVGSYVSWDRKLDGRLAQSLMSVQAIKSVEVGVGSGAAHKPGSEVMDEILPGSPEEGLTRGSNNSGGKPARCWL